MSACPRVGVSTEFWMAACRDPTYFRSCTGAGFIYAGSMPGRGTGACNYSGPVTGSGAGAGICINVGAGSGSGACGCRVGVWHGTGVGIRLGTSLRVRAGRVVVVGLLILIESVVNL